MSIRNYISIIIIFILSVECFAQRTAKVNAEYIYIVPENVTMERARFNAFDRAKIQAIADEFGTIVTQSNTTFAKNSNGESTVDFLSLSESEVKGEWIETIEGPKYEQGISKDGHIWIKCTAKGRIREIVSSSIDIIAKVLRNGIEEKFEGTDFRNGDDMYLFFKSPSDGYLAVYLVDETAKTAYCLLPYQQSSDAAQRITHDKPYVFFSPKSAPAETTSIVDEYIMTCTSGTIERNDIYVIFSPNSFSKANTSNATEELPRQLSWEKFNEWLARCRRHDKAMQVTKHVLTIKE